MSMKGESRSSARRDWLVAAFLVTIGLAQMAADLAGLPLLKGAAAAWGASPAPKVFSTVDGLETFTTRFRLDWTRPDGFTDSVALTPELYSRVRGPYNRRNVYGAALAYAPVLASDPLTSPMFNAAASYAFCRGDSLLAELGVAATHDGPYAIVLSPKETTSPNQALELRHAVTCRSLGITSARGGREGSTAYTARHWGATSWSTSALCCPGAQKYSPVPACFPKQSCRRLPPPSRASC